EDGDGDDDDEDRELSKLSINQENDHLGNGNITDNDDALNSEIPEEEEEEIEDEVEQGLEDDAVEAGTTIEVSAIDQE
ncbi:hypothetical protein B9K06_26860, partial [Bacillus sp. OG2]